MIKVVDAAMEQALRAVSVARGVDPTELALVAFGGAGPLHACALADALGMPAVIVPPRAGVLSAVGLLGAPRQHDLVRTWPGLADHDGLEDALAELAEQARAAVPGSIVETSLDCRYRGQSHELRVDSVASFAGEHRLRNGYDRPDTPIEVVAIRATARLEAPLDLGDLPVPERSGGVGPDRARRTRLHRVRRRGLDGGAGSGDGRAGAAAVAMSGSQDGRSAGERERGEEEARHGEHAREHARGTGFGSCPGAHRAARCGWR